MQTSSELATLKFPPGVFACFFEEMPALAAGLLILINLTYLTVGLSVLFKLQAATH